MDSFEINKIIGALLGVIFVMFSVSIVSEALFHAEGLETPGYLVEVPESDQGGDQQQEAAPESVLPLLADADPSAGEGIFKRCQACHTAEQGGANKVGPNLWNIVERPVASHEGFSYSAAMQEFAQGGETVWDYENLDHFLISPKGLVPGTAMAFAGLKKIEDRADLIAYLRTLSDNPTPLPEAGSEGANEEGDAAAGDQGAATEQPAADAEQAPEAEGDATQGKDAAAEVPSDEIKPAVQAQ
ncbi:c-type cytochrome [Nitratireductor luteus]|uniref:c-type cytochrome n=1 Tax=Nitratireductor luteus TaxID=2976980 RepID=UPI00223F4946|nr:cytochrome c family protein [Nitratireductor luteus]